MRLWVDAESARSAGTQIRYKIESAVDGLNRKALSRATRAVNALRNAELEVLRGQRSGRVYRKYPFKTTYRASAPGEPPASRTGNLRMHWNGTVETSKTGSGFEINHVLESQEHYAGYLENGTSRMAPRPFVDRISEKAADEIKKIYSEPY